MESDIRGKVVVFVCAVENHTRNGDDKHDGIAILLSVADICDPVHQEKCWQEPGHTIEFTGEI